MEENESVVDVSGRSPCCIDEQVDSYKMSGGLLMASAFIERYSNSLRWMEGCGLEIPRDLATVAKQKLPIMHEHTKKKTNWISQFMDMNISSQLLFIVTHVGCLLGTGELRAEFYEIE